MTRRMAHSVKGWRIMTVALLLAVALPLFFQQDVTWAKRGGDDGRERFYGLIEVRPAGGLQGEWVIGGRTIIAGPGTEFDQVEGPLGVGGCAKVDIRNGQVHEIDSEPMRDCR